ncbi:hypothetical protein GQ53DRAFT_809027 [Thozetella sp. PMI_491]|nr:hypothetical protein GQ53DRAFT_809027 [Thozetella sp. PMI_491]
MGDLFPDENIFFPGPHFHVDLAALDACHPVHYSRRLLLFRCETSEQRRAQLAALKVGLQALVKRSPILGGIIAPLPPDEAIDTRPDWRTILPGPGLELVVRDLRGTIASFHELEAAGFPPSKLPYGPLVPVPKDISNDRPYAACKVQFSAIVGGVILTFAMSHSVADGSATNELTRIWSEETRFAQESPGGSDPTKLRSKSPSAVIGVDRSVLRNMKSDIPFKIEDHPAYKWNIPLSAKAESVEPHPFAATSPETPVLFHISAASLARLKADATRADAPPVSTHDALAALMWRSVLVVRSRRSVAAQALLSSTPGGLFLPTDARRHLGLPESYIGNAVYQLTATLDFDTLFSAVGLQHAASAVRRAITAVDPALVANYMAMVNERWVDWGFLQSASTTGLGMSTDWTSGELYTQDWGSAFGPLIRFRYPGQAYSAILPKLPDGAAEFVVSVMPQEVEMLSSDECFGKYL